MKSKHPLKHFRRTLLASAVFLSGNIGHANADGDLIVDNDTQVISSPISLYNAYVGRYGTGTLTINDGGTLSNRNGYIGTEAGSTGNVTVTGSGSVWSNTSDLYVGYSGSGTLTIDNGATVNGNNIEIGSQANSTGTVIVTGSGSTLNNNDFLLIVGDEGSGTLLVEDGGSVTTTNLAVGYEDGGSGVLTLAGSASSLTVSDIMVVGTGSTSTGTLTIEDGATANSGLTYISYYEGASGSITVTGSGSTLNNASGVYLAVSGNGTLTIANGGLVTVGAQQTDGSYDGTVTVASDSTSTGTLIIGAAAGNTAVAAGTLKAANVAFGLGNGTLVFNHTDTNYDFTAAISSDISSNSSTIQQIAGFTTLSGDSSGFYGTTNVTGGTLNVTGTLGGTLYVSDEGTLSGTGTVGTTTILSGGTISPGGSGALGALSVNGNLTFESGSTYAVDLSGTASTRSALDSDLLTVTGNVTINGGTVSVQALDASTSYVSGHTYTIINSTGTLSGAFTNTISNSAFLTTAVSYDANNAYLTIAVADNSSSGSSAVFAPVAQTTNQLAVARSLDSLSQSGTSLELYNSMLVLSADQARKTYEQLSGDVYATAQSAFIQTSQAVNNTINTRMRSVTASVAAPSVAPLGYAEDETTKKPKDDRFAAYEKKEQTFDTQRFSAWATGFGSWGKVNGTGGGLDTNIGNGGVLFGADGLVTDSWRLGAMGGYSHSSFDTASSDGSSDNYHVGVYGTGQWGAISFRSGVNYTWSNVDATRQITALGQTLKGSYNADGVNAFGEVGYTVKTAVADFEPFAGVSYSSMKTDGFNESGGSAALTVDGQTMNTTFTTVGLRTSKNFDLLGTAAVARGTAGWVHAFGDVDPTSTARFASGDSFSVTGTPIDRDAALLEAGLDFNITPVSTLSITYTGQIGKNAYENGASAKLRVQF